METSMFVQQKFSEYYSQNYDCGQLPPSIENREFAFFLFKERMLRHKRFKTAEALRSFMTTIVPAHVYYSTAYYEDPEKPMDEKGWMGADLYFDIDADHIPTPCRKQHDSWKCRSCGNSEHGPPPKMCPSCGKSRFDEKSWPCEVCLESAKRETIKLIDVLTRDFGISPREVHAAFSGHRGYHVHVENEAIRTLNQIARREMVDYIVGIGLETKFHGLETGEGLNLEDAGWKGRIARGTYEFLSTATAEQLMEIELRKSIVSNIIGQRKRIQESWKGKGPWRILRGVGPKSWEKIVRQAIDKHSVKIDTVVTTDIHRLIRLANTLHGKTALRKTDISLTDIEDFDPLKTAIAFKHGEVSLKVSKTPRFRLGNSTYGPYKNIKKLELPTAAALFLICKGAAQVMEERSRVQ